MLWQGEGEAEPRYLPSLSPLSFALMTLKNLLFLLSQFSFHGNQSGSLISLQRCCAPRMPGTPRGETSREG